MRVLPVAIPNEVRKFPKVKALTKNAAMKMAVREAVPTCFCQRGLPSVPTHSSPSSVPAPYVKII